MLKYNWQTRYICTYVFMLSLSYFCAIFPWSGVFTQFFSHCFFFNFSAAFSICSFNSSLHRWLYFGSRVAAWFRAVHTQAITVFFVVLVHEQWAQCIQYACVYKAELKWKICNIAKMIARSGLLKHFARFIVIFRLFYRGALNTTGSAAKRPS